MSNGNSLGEAGGQCAGGEVLMPWWLAVVRKPRPNGATR